ncbi:hypothetical protein CGJ15_24495, partial [Vibrio parahaemolyticus]
NIFKVYIVRASWELSTIFVVSMWSKSFMDNIVPMKFVNNIQMVGETLSIKAGSELVVSPEEEFSLAVQMIAVRVLPPEGEVHMPSNVVNV